MPSFNGLYTVRSGLDAARRALDLVGQNVANANTQGYSRQEASFVSADPTHVLRAGRGISEVVIMRYRDQFLDRQYRSRSGFQGFADGFAAQLQHVEEVVGTLAEGGLRTSLDQFFNAWDTLSQRPSDPAARFNVVQAAEDFLNMARSTFADLQQVRVNLDEAVREKVEQVNSAAQQVADLNKAIMAQEVSGQPANDLRDQRDRLLDVLSRLAGASVTEHTDGSVTVHLGSLPLVNKHMAYPITPTAGMEPDLDGDPALVSDQQNLTTFSWNGTPVPFGSGEVAALLQVRDQVVPDYMKYLDTMVRTLATQVNAIHTRNDSAGNPLATPTAIFTDTSGASPLGARWMDIAVNPALKSDPSLLMAGDTVPTAAHDGQRALDIARLRDQASFTGAPVGTRQVTPGEFLRAISSHLGLQVQQAVRQSEGAALQVAQTEQQRQSVSGVSLDDEMTKMIQFQQAYNAAARMMTTMDEMLDVVVNRVGLVGR